MDEATLLAPREAWSVEPSPSLAALTRLTAEEAKLYEALVRARWLSPVVELVEILVVEPVETKPVETPLSSATD